MQVQEWDQRKWQIQEQQRQLARKNREKHAHTVEPAAINHNHAQQAGARGPSTERQQRGANPVPGELHGNASATVYFLHTVFRSITLTVNGNRLCTMQCPVPCYALCEFEIVQLGSASIMSVVCSCPDRRNTASFHLLQCWIWHMTVTTP